MKDADTGTKRRVVGLGAGLVAATSLAIILIVVLLLIVTRACGGQCSAPWVYQVSFPQGTTQAVIEKTLDQCSHLPVVTSVDPKETDLYGPHVLTSSRDPGQIHRLLTCLKSGGAIGIDFPD